MYIELISVIKKQCVKTKYFTQFTLTISDVKYIYNNITQAIIVFCSRAGVSLQTRHSPLYPLLSLSLRICTLSICHNVVYHLIYSSALNIFAVYHSFSRQFLLTQWPSQFLFLFFISSSILFPLFLAQQHFPFCLSILHAPFFSISTSQILPAVFAHSVVVSRSLHHTTL